MNYDTNMEIYKVLKEIRDELRTNNDRLEAIEIALNNLALVV